MLSGLSPVTGAVYRALATPRSGRTFVAFMMNYKTADNQGANKFVGLSLMGTATNACDREEIFFGKPAGAGQPGVPPAPPSPAVAQPPRDNRSR